MTAISILTAKTLRSLIEQMNQQKITKAHVISLMKDNEQYILIYEKE